MCYVELFCWTYHLQLEPNRDMASYLRHVLNEPGHQGFDPRLPFPKGDCELGVALHRLDGGLRERWRTDTAVGRAEGFRGILNHRKLVVFIRNNELRIQVAQLMVCIYINLFYYSLLYAIDIYMAYT